MKPKLHALPGSPNSRKVLALVRYLDLEPELNLIDPSTGIHKQPDFLAKNPNGLLPLLEVGDFCLWESNAILQYIDDTHGNRLGSTDARERAEISRWQFWETAHWGPQTGILTWEKHLKQLFTGAPADPARVEEGIEAYHKIAKVLESHLKNRDYVACDRLTIADFSVAAPLTYAKESEHPLDEYKNIAAWLERVNTVPAWSETAPQKMFATA